MRSFLSGSLATISSAHKVDRRGLATSFEEGKPPLAGGALEERDWRMSNLARDLRTGVTPAGDIFGGSTGEVVQFGRRFHSPRDLNVMATYLIDSNVMPGDKAVSISEKEASESRVD